VYLWRCSKAPRYCSKAPLRNHERQTILNTSFVCEAGCMSSCPFELPERQSYSLAIAIGPSWTASYAVKAQLPTLQ
jgi:hypothetical protein